MTDQATQTITFSSEQLKLLMESGIPIDNLIEEDTPGDELRSNLGGDASVTDKEYLELAEHAKSIVDSAQLQSEVLKKENLELKKIIITSYGFIRVLDDIFDLEIPPEASYVLESIRSYLSQYIETNIIL